MQFLTWLEINTKVRNDCDQLDKIFITDTEMLGYANEAIDDCEALIHTIYEDYFLASANLTAVSATSTIALPSDVYANKIRRILFNDGAKKYDVKRLKNLSEIPYVETTDDMRYLITNIAGTGNRIKLFPAPDFSDATTLTVYYIRNAKKLALTTDECDVPEFVNYVMQHMKVRCYEKELHPNTGKAVQDKEQMRTLMVETLTCMVPDEDTVIEPDLSFYDEFDSDYYGGFN